MTTDQFKRMSEKWNFAVLHLLHTWNDLTDVSDEIKNKCKQYAIDFNTNPIKNFERMKEGKKPGLFLFADTKGNGKTTLVHQIAKDIVTNKKGIKRMVYVGGVEMFNELKKTFRPEGGIGRSNLLDNILEADLFILDDFDKLIRWSPYEREQATLIFDKRYSSLKPTIITANKSLEQLKNSNQLEDHVYSRLVAMCTEIECNNDVDYRLEASKESKEKPTYL
jgi:DNA replication protein DnaC